MLPKMFTMEITLKQQFASARKPPFYHPRTHCSDNQDLAKQLQNRKRKEPKSVRFQVRNQKHLRSMRNPKRSFLSWSEHVFCASRVSRMYESLYDSCWTNLYHQREMNLVPPHQKHQGQWPDQILRFGNRRWVFGLCMYSVICQDHKSEQS